MFFSTYKLTFKSGKIYVGATNDFMLRLQTHRIKFKKNYNDEIIEYEIIDKARTALECAINEQKLINKYYGSNCYNIQRKSFYCKDLKHEKNKKEYDYKNMSKKLMKITKSKEYFIDPEMLEAHEYFNFTKPESGNMEFLNDVVKSIINDGQKYPIYLYRGKIIDGLTRVKACEMINIKVKAVDLTSNANLFSIEKMLFEEKKEYEKKYIKTKTQKAIAAFNSSLKNKMTYHVLAQQFGVNEKLIKYVSFIYNKAKRPDILDKLLDNHLVSIEGRKPTDSLSAVAKALKEEMEKDIIRDESEVVHWSADAYLRTEESKDWYYNQVRMLNLDNNVPVKMLLVELANLKFKREL